MSTLLTFSTPQLQGIHCGKVRDSFRVSADTRLLVASDRLSAFDRVLDSAIPGKGAILNRLSAYWFKETAHTVSNHLIRVVADRAMLVREVEPVRVEIIVRAFITGSAWRAYASGQRILSGVRLPEGLTKNARLAEPIITPTTKDVHDTQITPEALIEAGLATSATYKQMEAAARSLFARGTEILHERGLLLVDTKYEFGLLDGEVVLIDELHTPDSFRFWAEEDYIRDPENVPSWDKEFVRRWLLEQSFSDDDAIVLPDGIVAETQRRYADLYERITGESAPAIPQDASARLVQQLVDAGLMKDACITIVMGSPKDHDHAAAIADYLAPYDVAVRLRVASAHKTPALVEALAQQLSASAEPGVIIAVAGLSNGLGGALAATSNLPVINCPPFSDRADLALNINSSLMMPSSTPAMTVIKPQNAALAAIRCLNLPRLRQLTNEQTGVIKASLARADAACQET